MTQTGEKEKGDLKTCAVIGAAMEVHRNSGCSFLEAVYQEALALETAKRRTPSDLEVELPVYYRGQQLSASYRTDFACFGSVAIGLKALDRLGGIEEAQIINYLKASGFEVGLLLNFRGKSREYHRFVLSSPSESAKSV
jgi:GxxExxY protein